MIKPPDPGQRRIEARPGENHATDEATPLLQRRQVSALRARERELENLRERERNLEVERIAAEVALRALTPSGQLKLAPGKASDIIEALGHIRTLERRLSRDDERLANHRKAHLDAVEQLQTGVQTLHAWLEAPRLSDLQQTRRTVRVVLLGVAFGAISAAFTFHPAFLLLLLPVGPILVLLRSGQDIEWRRLGVKRRFKETSLDGPVEWSEQSVRRRVAELQAATANAWASVPVAGQAPHVVDIERASRASELADEKQGLADLLVDEGLAPDALDGDLEQRIRLMAEVERSQQDLSDVQQARKAATVESNELREQLFAYPAQRCAAPPGGHAGTPALAEGLDRLIARRRKGREA